MIVNHEDYFKLHFHIWEVRNNQWNPVITQTLPICMTCKTWNDINVLTTQSNIIITCVFQVFWVSVLDSKPCHIPFEYRWHCDWTTCKPNPTHIPIPMGTRKRVERKHIDSRVPKSCFHVSRTWCSRVSDWLSTIIHLALGPSSQAHHPAYVWCCSKGHFTHELWSGRTGS